MVGRRLLRATIVILVLFWLFRDTHSRYSVGNADSEVLRFAHFGTYEDYEFWADVLARFNERNPAVRARQEFVAGVGDEYNTKLRQQIAARTMPHVAVVQLQRFHEMADAFAPLDDLLEYTASGDPRPTRSLDAAALSAFRVNQTQRGLPISGGTLQIFLNQECIRRAETHHGVAIDRPIDTWTIEQFHHLARQLTCDFDHDGTIDQFGLWLPRWVYFQPFLWGFGADICDESCLRWTLHGPYAERAIRFYRTLAVDDRVTPREDEVAQLFQDVGFLTGRTAMCINGPWFVALLERTRLRDAYSVHSIP